MSITRASIISMILSSMLLVSSIACSHQPNDQKIVKDIQNKVAADPDTKDSQVDVASTKGKVKLNGTVKTPAAQQKVEKFAREEPGIADVDDETTVQPEAAALPEPASPRHAQGEAATTTPPAPAEGVEKPQPQPIIVPAGTALTVTTSQPLSSKTSQAGQGFAATLAQPVSIDGRMALPKGASVNGTVVSAKSQGKIKGGGELALALTSVSFHDQTYEIQTNVLKSEQKGKGKRTAATTGGGAAGGALIGGLAGGGKGAGIGALAGAGAGLIGGAMTGNKQIEIPAESALSFTLAVPLTLPPPPSE
jgi:BON domain